MKLPRLHHKSLVFAAALAANAATLAQPANRIRFNGQDLFLNGLNLAWSSFANDIGPNASTPNLAHFENVFSQMNASGANAMRLWLHTTGAHTPAWSGQMVTGPGSGTIEDLRAILDLAWQYDCGLILCLWSFDMLRISNGTTVTDRAMAILTQEANRQSYIDNALVPMVEALKDHPAIICWEIFNEPEGMSNEHGWEFNRHVPMAAIQAFVNKCAGAIHRADPGVLVSNGSWAFIASSDVGAGNFNYYTDARLIAAGGDPDGTLDFYMVHYYDWAGTSRSPFHHPASHWGLDKPLVIAEFYPDCANCGEHSHELLYQNGYAGALSWSWTDVSPASLLVEIAHTSAGHPDDILVEQPGRPLVLLTAPADRSWYVLGFPVVLEASASDPDGSISKVVFYRDSVPVGEDTTAPYSIELANLPTGSWPFYAAAIDNDGIRSRSREVTLIVGRPDLIQRMEAEDAAYSGVTLKADPQAGGGACLDMRGSGSIEWTITDVPVSGTYDLVIGYNLAYDTPKTNLVSVNTGPNQSVVFNTPAGAWAEKTIQVSLQAGTNTIRITPSWGWMLFDYISLPALATPPPPEIGVRIEPSAADARLLVYGPPGIEYELMTSPDLRNWSVAGALNPPVTPALIVDAARNSQAVRYYRIRHTAAP